MKKQTIKQKNKTKQKTKNTKLNRSSFGVSSLLGGLKNKKKSLEAMKTRSKKLLKLHLENNSICITTPLSQNPT